MVGTIVIKIDEVAFVRGFKNPIKSLGLYSPNHERP